MSRGRTARVFTRRIVGAEGARVPDELIVEEPMSIRVDGELVATTMRTPGNDFELAAGFCVTEGLLGDAEVRTIRYCGQGPASEAEFNDVTVDTYGTAPVPTPRLGPASSSCGICGTVAIEGLLERLVPLDVEPFDPEVLAGVTEQIDAIRESATSIMPQGLDKTLTPGQLADLLAFLRSCKAATATATTGK